MSISFYTQASISSHPTIASTLHTVKNKVCNGLNIVKNVVLEVGIESAVFLITAVALHLLFPPLAPCFYGLAAATFATDLVIKIINSYNDSLLEALTIKCYKLIEKFSYVQLVTLIFAIVIGCFFPILGCILASVLGVYNGIVVDMINSKKLQEINGKITLGNSWLH